MSRKGCYINAAKNAKLCMLIHFAAFARLHLRSLRETVFVTLFSDGSLLNPFFIITTLKNPVNINARSMNCIGV